MRAGVLLKLLWSEDCFVVRAAMLSHLSVLKGGCAMRTTALGGDCCIMRASVFGGLLCCEDCRVVKTTAL